MDFKINLYLFIIMLFFFGCKKTPEANFTMDKTEYTAGDVVHLTDASIDAYNWKWLLPDGEANTNKNVDYYISIDKEDDFEVISLEAFSKKNKKSSVISKTIKVYPYSEFYSNPNNKYIPNNISCGPLGNNWRIYSSVKVVPSSPQKFIYCSIYLPGSTAPLFPKTYFLQSSDTISQDSAKVKITYFDPEKGSNSESYISTYGTVSISLRPNGKIRAKFNMNSISSSNNVNFQGDLTCH